MGKADKSLSPVSVLPVRNESPVRAIQTPDPQPEALSKALSYAEHKEQQKRLKRAEKAVKESEARIEQMEVRLKELDELLMQPENASDMVLVTEYTTTKRTLDEEMERWERLSEELLSL